jgi:xanthine dehydrogenase accessory factor
MKRKEFVRVRESIQGGRSATIDFEVGSERYTRCWLPKERLILLGGGHIAQPLCEVGALLGYEVTVVDDRPYFANKARFPKADYIICDEFTGAIENLQINDNDYVCVITRGHRYDADCVRKILSGTEPYYLGMIGSKRRTSALKAMLIDEGFDTEKINRLNAPIGLPIKAETTAEIAISIAAQLVEYRRGGKLYDGCLKEKNADLALLDVLCSDMPLALALVLDTKGSTPVKSGAVMAVNALGQTWGTVGGGCSEAEVIAVARQMTDAEKGKLVTVDMTNDVAEAEGMVCGGTMRVLIEPIV